MPIDLEPPGATQVSRRESFATSFRRKATTIFFFLAAIWIVWLVDDFIFGRRLENFGVVPRTVHGLIGIVTMPFLHASWSHVWGNSLGIVFLGGLLILRSDESFWAVSIFGALASGLGTWLIGGSNSMHVGASGVIFAYFGFLLSAGIFERRIVSFLMSLIVFFIWGGMLWSVLPSHGEELISWQGHLCGFASGVLLAKLIAQGKPAATALNAGL